MNIENERLCNMIQNGNDVEDNKALLLQQNRIHVYQYAMEALAEALEDTAAICLDDMMEEAVKGFNRAAETYTPGTGCLFIVYAEPWVKAKVKSYIRRAERNTLPDQITQSIGQYRRMMEFAHEGIVKDWNRIRLEERLKNMNTAAGFLLGAQKREAVFGCN